MTKRRRMTEADFERHQANRDYLRALLEKHGTQKDGQKPEEQPKR